MVMVMVVVRVRVRVRVRVKSTPRHTGGMHKQFFLTVTQEVFKEDRPT